MTCLCNTKTPSRYCWTSELDGRIAYRLYCPVCLGFVGSKVKKELAIACGYELTEQRGSTVDYECRQIGNDIANNPRLRKLRIGAKKILNHESFVLFDSETREQLRFIPDFFIKWAKFSLNDWNWIVKDIVDLTPIEPIYRPKVPRDLLADYSAYIESTQWQRKRSERMAIDRKQCVLCGSVQNLQVHHVTYERLFNEKMADLMTVCKSCHEILHDREF